METGPAVLSTKMPGTISSTSAVLRGALMASSFSLIGVTATDAFSRVRFLEVEPVTTTTWTSSAGAAAAGAAAVSGVVCAVCAEAPQASTAIMTAETEAPVTSRRLFFRCMFLS